MWIDGGGMMIGSTGLAVEREFEECGGVTSFEHIAI